MTAVRFTDEDHRCRVAFPYDEQAVRLLKETVPSVFRRYDPSTKGWLVDRQWTDRLRDAFKAAGHDVGDGSAPPPPPKPRGEPGSLGFTSDVEKAEAEATAAAIIASIPAHLHGRVFRAMARQLYPDLYRRTR